MRIELVEYELVCARHGAHLLVIPARCPLPLRCAHCFLDLASRTELRRYTVEGPVEDVAKPEAWVG